MNSTVIALLAFAGIFGTALLGMRLRAALPDHHLSAEAKESVRVGMGLVATMTALLLGLLIATAKGSYDTQRTQVIQIAAYVGFLDRLLAVYGPETVQTRELLRGEVENVIPRLWPQPGSQSSPTNLTAAQAQALYTSLQNLTPQNDAQRSLKAQALVTTMDLSKTVWLLSAQRDPSIVTPLLVAVILWLATIFLSFGLFAPANKTVVATMLIVALAVSSALFLMLELDRPFDGVIQISSAPLRNVLSQLGR
ncbi:MAG TPA: hypothetical protein VGN90_10700 [Pyrinomonadaceae bacterium]|jgi:hypothetical protein|nr:hypothetical protein [Pyrinomonadaceae bacterium]